MAKETDACTMTSPATLGMTWRTAIPSGERPAARAATTYSVFITPSAPERVMRAKAGIVAMPMAIIATRVEPP